jgi:protein TonB
VFTQSKPASNNRSAAISFSAHALFLFALIYRPLTAAIIKPSDLMRGDRAPVTELVYASPLELHAGETPSPRLNRPIRVAQARPANPVPEPLRAGTPEGTLPAGPTTGFVRQPALPIVGPDVPRSSLPDGIRGDVIVEITIDTQGNVAETRVLQSLGPEVDEKVVATLHNWHFRPATTDGVANVSKQDVHFHFPS